MMGLVWDEVTWDILSPRCVLLFHLGKGLYCVVDCLPQAQRRRVREPLECYYG